MKPIGYWTIAAADAEKLRPEVVERIREQLRAATDEGQEVIVVEGMRLIWMVAEIAGYVRAEITTEIYQELERAYAKHGRDRWGRHEAYAIILEELEEAWDAIKADAPPERVRAELIQVAAMVYRYLETGDRYLSQTWTTIPDGDPGPIGTEPAHDNPARGRL